MKVTHGKNTPVLVPIRGDATQTSGDMFKKNENINPKYKDQNETFYKTKPFTFCTCPHVYAGPSWNKQLIKELQAPAPGRSRFGELNLR